MATFERKHQSTIAGTPVVGVPVVRRRQPMAKNATKKHEGDESGQSKLQAEAAAKHAEYCKRQGVKPTALDAGKKTKKSKED
jgi:hypothetical protein